MKSFGIKKFATLHPFLFAAWPILSFYAHNISEASLHDTLSLLAIALPVTALLILLVKFVIKDSDKAGIIVSLFSMLFFSYGHLYDLELNWSLVSGHMVRHRYLMSLWGIIFICSFYFIVKTHRDLLKVIKILNFVAFSLVAMSFINIGVYELKSLYDRRNNNRFLENRENYPSSAGNSYCSRDIYYIILDGYARSDILKEMYNYDNRGFIDYLTKKGFYVACESQSNYAMTPLSLASSLNMEYVNCMNNIADAESNNQRRLSRLIENNKVLNFLKSKGYKYIHISSGCGLTDRNRYADLNIRHSRSNEFLMAFVQTTMLNPFEVGMFAGGARHRVLYNFSKLAEMHKIKEPKFIFAHMMIPHPPFIFDANGEPARANILKMGGAIWMQKENYINQLIFANKKVEELVDDILSNSETPPIIILQADHGPAAALSSGIAGAWQNPTKAMIRERFNIFNAYYLPDGGKDLLYGSITPVNTFRLIFKFYFNTNYELLADESYFSNYDSPYKFINVTDTVSHN